MSVSPTHLQICISGPGVLKCYSLGQDGSLKPSSLVNPSKETETYLETKWLPQIDALHRFIHVVNVLVMARVFRLMPSPLPSSPCVCRLVAVSQTEIVVDGSRRQLIYVFEGADTPSGTVGPPINLEFRQTISPHFETPNGSVLGLTTFSKGD
jgi:hypothetical protein